MKSHLLATLSVVTIGIQFASATLYNLSGPIDPQQATTNPSDLGTGSGTIAGTYDDATGELNYTLTWEGITSAISNMHFHVGAPGVSGGVDQGIPGPWTSPYTNNGILDLDMEANLLAGNWYVNIHTGDFGTGEIRGQVLVEVAPTPSGLLAYYPFEGDYTDATANGNDAAAGQNPGEVSFVAGFRGQGADINDPDANGGGNNGGTIDIPISVDKANLPEVSFGGWVNVETNNGFPGFMATDNGGWDRGMSLNNNQWSIASGGNVNSGISPVLGEWEFVVGTFNGVDAVLYVGNDDAATTTTATTTRPDAHTDPGLGFIEIGRFDNQDLDAVVDDIFVFAEALSAAKVNAIRNLRLNSTDYSPAQAAELFLLFDASTAGDVSGTTWTPVSGLTAGPGELEDLGAQGVAVVLNDLGEGMVGDSLPPLDGDNDGLPDSWEVDNFGDTTTSDGTGDNDTDGGPDGLTDLEEFEAGTDPNDSDSDDDGVNDGDEITNMTNPLAADSDNDGLNDGEEVTEMTDPNNPDSDGDGLSDGEEVNIHTTDPNDADSDGDGFSDFDEVNNLPPTDPNDVDDFPVPADLSLLAYFPFEGDYNDATGNGFDAAPVQNPGEVSIIPDGFRGQAADINDPDMNGGGNTGGTIDIPINTDPGTLVEVSFGGWVNVETNNGFPGFMATDNGGWDRGMSLNNNQWSIASGNNTNSGVAPVLGNWEYVIGTFDGTDATIYVGDDDPNTQTTTSVSRPDAQGTPGLGFIEIGRYDNQDLDAAVDDIFVFSGALTPHEANAIRNLRLSSLDLSPLGAGELFALFRAGTGGQAGELNWSLVTGLDPTNPGEVFGSGGGVSVVLDDLGNGMRSSGNNLGFSIVREGNGTLTLTWDSQDGKLYRVRSESDLEANPVPADWPVYLGNEDIAGLPPENTLNIAFPGDAERYFVVEEYNPPPVTLFSDDFESGLGGWTTGANAGDGGNTLWSLGTPSVAPDGPIAANSPVNCFGTNIDDNYEVDSNIWLRSPPIDLTGAAAATLRYFHFTDIEMMFDSGTVRILDNADDSELAVIATGIDGTITDWRQVTRNLPAAALGKTIKLEFLFQSDNFANQAGWYIDDVEVTTP